MTKEFKFRVLLSSLLIFLLLISLWQYAARWYEDRLIAEKRAEVSNSINLKGNALSNAINRRFALIEGLQAFILTELNSKNTLSPDGFKQFAAGLYAGLPGIRAIQALPRGVVRYLYPRAGNEQALGHDLLHDSRPDIREDVRRTMRTRQPSLSSPYQLRQGGLGVIERLAIYRDRDAFWGLAVIVLDVQPLLDVSGITTTGSKEDIAIRDKSKKVFFGNEKIFQSEPVTYRIELPDGNWELAGIPKRGWGASIRKPIWFFNAIGFGIVLMLTTIYYLIASRQVSLTTAVQQRTSELQLELAERRRIEELLRISESQFRTLIEVAPSVIICLSPEGTIFEFNSEAEKVYGFKKGEVIGKSYFELFIPPEIRDMAIQDMTKVLSGEPTKGYVNRIKISDKKELIFSWDVDCLLDDKEQPIGIVAIGHDITQMKRTEEELRENALEIDLALTAGRMGVWYSNILTSAVFTIRGSGPISGLPKNIYPQTNEAFWALVHQDDRSMVIKRLEQAIKGEAEYEVEFKAVLPDGTVRWVYAKGQVVRNEIGEPVALTGVDMDITERKQVEEALKSSEEKYRELVQNSNSIILRMDKYGTITFFNEYAQYFFGFTQDEIIGKKVMGTIVPSVESTGRDLSLLIEAVLLYPEHYERNENENIKKNGERVWISWANKIIFDDSGNVTAILSIGQDVTERKKIEVALKTSEEKFRAVFDSANDGILLVNKVDRNFHLANESICKMLGYTCAEMVSLGVEDIHPRESLAFVMRQFEKAAAGKATMVHNIPVLRKDGSIFYADINTSSVALEGKDYLVAVFRDITERRSMEEAIRHQAYHDSLTNLPNKALFVERLDFALNEARHKHAMLSVMFLDLDRFKNINDSLGHTIGDELLKEVARRLNSFIRESDTLARIGGDEFTILLPEITHTKDISAVAEKIMSAVQKIYRINSYEFFMTASAGISIYPEDGEHAEILLKHADVAMYYAKEQGRNNYQYYNPALNVRTFERMLLESSLRKTLEHRELMVYYQPQVDIATRRLVGIEALVRWKHPELGLLGPGQFLPLADEIGFIVSIDEWVLRTACHQLKVWQEEGDTSLRISVNLSSRQFRQIDMAELVSQILKETDLPPDSLELEVTETIAMQDIELNVSTMSKLVEKGINFSIDDFGTGYSSLSHLKKLPIHKLKIDKSFIRDVTTDEDDKTIVRAIISMAHSMGIKVIAEGVETDEQCAFLRDSGCDQMQGYLYSEPLSTERFKRLIEHNR